MERLGVKVVLASHWAHGGKGAADLANIVVDLYRHWIFKFRQHYK
jgi:formate--tetrahydrofolate ligase